MSTLLIVYLAGVFFIAGILFAAERKKVVPIWKDNFKDSYVQKQFFTIIVECLGSWFTLLLWGGMVK